jgi:SAM-dependent methyltransferase
VNAPLHLLCCPRCRAPLAAGEQRWACTDAACACSRDGFPVVGAQPCLVDFDDSILDRAELVASGGASRVVRRGGGPTAALKRIAHRLWRSDRFAQGLAARFLATAARGAGKPRILVVGGGSIGRGAEPLYAGAAELIAFDIYASPSTQFVADAHRIPCPDGVFDGVWIQAVLEHVLEPDRVVAEIHRVLRPEGVVGAITPFLQHVHEGAYDFTRFTHSGHRWLFRRFAEIEAGATAGPGLVAVWSARYLVRGLARTRKAGIVSALALFWLAWLDRLVPAPFRVDAASAVYFLGRRADTSLQPRDMVDYYRGAGSR